jgi:dihydropteroate synthase
MAVLNRTPDSFSDGGRYLDDEAGLQHAELLVAGGADIIDIGGESTRPGAAPVTAAEEQRRVVPMVAELRRRHPDLAISVDTSKPEVADTALEAGADLVNDVTAAGDGRMLELVARRGAAIVLMHMRGTPSTMQLDTGYRDVVAEVRDFLARRAAAAVAAGIPHDRVWLDPGIGFGKDVDGNLRLLAALPELAGLGHPVVVGASRKSFLGRLTGAGVDGRLAGSLAALIPAVGLERAVVRVHDPEPTRHFLEVASRLREATS